MMDNRMDELFLYFQECMADTNLEAGAMIGEAKASCPIAVVCLGKKSDDPLGEEVRRQMQSLWPAYKNILLFLGVDEEEEKLSFRTLDRGKLADADQLRERLSELFEENSYFRVYNRLLVFYLLDTTALEGEVDLEYYFQMIQKVSREMSFPNQTQVLCMTLDERIGHERQAQSIRNQLADVMNQTDSIAPCCIYLVSNKSSMGSQMPRKNYFGKIFADLIVLADGTESYISTNVVHSGIKTVGYATRQKPVADIAKVSVSSLLRKLSELPDMKLPDRDMQMSAEDKISLMERLGVDESGCFYMLDSYVEAAQKEFPSEEVLEAFPRKTCEDMDLYSLPVSRVDEETFGVWSCYMGTIVRKIEESIAAGFQRGSTFREDYLQDLKKKYTGAELIWMSRNPEEVAAYLKREHTVKENRNVIASLKEELAIRAFQDAAIQQAMLDVITAAGKEAGEFRNAWSQLLESSAVIVDQQDVAQFYEPKVQRYVDQNAERISREFRTVSNAEGIMEFLRKEIRSLVRSDQVYQASFEEELLERMGQKDPENALRSISGQLTGGSVKIWLSSSGSSIGGANQKTLLLKTDSRLHETIAGSLNMSEYYTCDAGRGESADALNIYLLDEYQLRI